MLRREKRGEWECHAKKPSCRVQVLSCQSAQLLKPTLIKNSDQLRLQMNDAAIKHATYTGLKNNYIFYYAECIFGLFSNASFLSPKRLDARRSNV